MKTIQKMALALGCALFFAGTAFAQLPDGVAEKFNQAAEMINQKQFVEAIPLLESVLSEGEAADPESEVISQSKNLLPECYFRKAGAAASKGDFEGAIAAMNQADALADKYSVTAVTAKVDNMFPKIYTAYGGTFFNNKDYAKAIEIFSQAYTRFPNDTKMSMLLAKSYAESGDMTKAEEIYKSIIALGGTHDKYAAAATEAKGDLANYLLVDAQKASEAKDLDGVVKATDAVLAFDPTNGPANLMRLSTAINVKNYSAAIGFGEAAAEAQSTDEERSSAYFLLGAAYQNTQNKAKAIEMYKKVTAGANVATAKAQIAELSK